MPQTSNHDSIPPHINAIADDICTLSEWNDQLSKTRARRRATAFRLIGKRMGSLK
jgi:hypothetical protein